MGAGFLTACDMWLPSLTGQSAGPRGREAATFLCILLLATFLVGCSSVNVLILSSENFTPANSQIEILDRPPTRPYVRIAVLSLDSWWLSDDSRRQKIAQKATTLGADAVVFGELSLSSPGMAVPSIPSPSLPSKDTQNVIPDDLHRSLGEGTLDPDVRVYLVRAGGHGGARGGGHGHGGHWGGRAGHSGFRHWRHGVGPGYPGYGYYGPASRGYGPYCGLYYYPYSCYGGYPDAGYGDQTLTVGTAIHYTVSALR